jgi:hypothetical protein
MTPERAARIVELGPAWVAQWRLWKIPLNNGIYNSSRIRQKSRMMAIDR